ncbi:hypothetical protein GCM10010528_05620 [Gordonia defluvii]|jgi:D-alanyl-D-alanine dipeptidase|uniref:D-alanyl-D-alanine carboxypeptidase-like core domain-containing protein n=1 Tax=Gordonia defluvii TaxID=283718 RepID=A0ABP6L1B9_9ACTN|nr:M15 family metallopeptidase [Gordonia sp. UBA5067]
MPSRRSTAAVLATVTALAVPAAAAADAAPAPTGGLTPQLTAAFQNARSHAQREGVALWITSGKRSWAEQDQMWREGIRTYGSPAVARRWVLPPGESSHVTGRAIDVGPLAGAQWLARTGPRWGLCRTYANEWWHFEVAPTPCPRMRPDAAHH